MTVPNEVPLVDYVGNGTTTEFNVPFQYETASTLFISVNGVNPSTSDYLFNPNTGNFVFYTAPADGAKIRITRDTPEERDTDYDDNYNTFRPRTLNKDFDRLWRAIQEHLITINLNKDGLAQEILDRIQADENMLDYIMNQDNAIKQDYIQRDSAINTASIERDNRIEQESKDRDSGLKNYIDNLVALITGDPSFNGITTDFVTEDGETQRQKNDKVKRGIANKYDPALTYNLGERVLLDDGTEVISTIASNTNNPNVDMAGWVFENILTLDSISELSDKYGFGAIAFVKDTDSFYIYDVSSSAISVNSWSLIHDNSVKTKSLSIQDGDDITDLISYADTNNLFLELERGKTFTTTVFDSDIQKLLIGDGSVQFIYDYLTNDNTENVAPKIAKPYKKDSIYGWYDSVEARGNFEHGAGYGLMVNSDSRPQVCGFRTKQQQKDYPSVDMVGLYTHVESPRSVTLSNCTFTANSVYSPDLTSSMDIRVGDFIRTAIDPAIGMPWRSEITSIDYATKTLSVTWWLHEIGNGDGIPPNGLTCQAPYTNGLWGHNTNVFLHADRSAQTIIGYELGVWSEKPRDRFHSIDGYLAVNLTSQVARTQHAYTTGGTWDKGLGAYNCTSGVFTNGTTKYGLNFAPTADADSAAIRYDLNTRKTGNIVQSVAGADTLFSMSALGVVSHTRQNYRVCSASDIQHATSPTLVIGASAVAHTTTIDAVNIPPKTIFTFKQTKAVNWTIIAGPNSFVLNTSGTMDYLQLYFDGNYFTKLFAGKSL